MSSFQDVIRRYVSVSVVDAFESHLWWKFRVIFMNPDGISRASTKKLKQDSQQSFHAHNRMITALKDERSKRSII